MLDESLLERVLSLKSKSVLDYGCCMGKCATGRTPVMHADETIAKVRGNAKLVASVADAESGESLPIDMLVDRNSERFPNWLRGYVNRLGSESVITDDSSTYKHVVNKLGLDRQVCVLHMKKNVERRLRMVRGWQEWKSRRRMYLRSCLMTGASG